MANTASNSNIATSPYVAAGSLTTYLFLGTNSQQVKTLQQILNKKGFTIAVSGSGSTGNESTYFSTSTQAALQRFQCSGLSICSGTPLTTGYGATGPRTRALLNGSTYVSTSTPTPTISPVVSPVVAPKTTTTVKTTVKVPVPVATPTISFPTTQPTKTNQVY